MSPSSSTPFTESPFRFGLNTALSISKGATTSRVVVNNEVLRTVIFTSDAGQVLTKHSFPRAAIVTLLEGEMDLPVGERIERVDVGDIICLAPDDHHALTVVTPCRMQLMTVDIDKATVANEKQPGSGQSPTDREPSD